MRGARATAVTLGLALFVACGGDDATESGIELTPGVPVSRTIGAAGGSLNLGRATLEVPAGALASDTTITITPLEVAGGTLGLLLEPDGLTFARPATLRVDLAAAELQALADASTLVLPLLVSTDGTTEVPDATWEPAADGGVVMSTPIPHFSMIMVHLVPVDPPFEIESLSRTPPLKLPVGPVFSHFVQLVQRSATVMMDEATDESYLDVAGTAITVDGELRSQLRFAVSSMTFAGLYSAVGYGPILQVGDKGVFLDSSQSTRGGMPFRCAREGSDGSFVYSVVVAMHGAWSLPGYRLVVAAPITLMRAQGTTATGAGLVTLFADAPELAPITCEGTDSVLMAFQDEEARADAVRRYKSVQEPACYSHSNGQLCRPAAGSTRLVAALDPVISVGAAAAARLTAAFPCGDSPGRKVLCGTPGPFPAGDHVMLVATLDEPAPLADPVGRYQTAFVFDADGVAANNYRASAMYPGDFFAGTDRWYEALYAPGTGWSLKVTDVRVGPQPQPSRARFVIAGHELALFVPRDELGATPSFRVSTFRHEGDFGLQGGPWALSYSPLLDEPLYPAASGPPILVPD